MIALLTGIIQVVEESQLVFRGGGGGSKKNRSGPTVQEGSMDCICMIDDTTFVTGSDNGSMSYWQIHKKKPIFTLTLAHGKDPTLSPGEASAELNPDLSILPASQPRWITALATIPYSDVILSGSWDGCVRAWKVSEDKKKIEAMGVVGTVSSARGVINDISVFERGDRGKDGVCVIAALGKEHRFGRWQKHKDGKNGAVVFEIPRIRRNNGVVENSTEVASKEDEK